MRTQSGHSLPPSLALLAEPVHVNVTDPELMWEHEIDTEVNLGVAQNSNVNTSSGEIEEGPSTIALPEGQPAE